jgi:hypothetical protein
MPHTIHLAAIKVLCAKLYMLVSKKVAIGAVSAAEGKKALLRGGNYQECVTAPISEATDDLVALQDEVDDDKDRDRNILKGSDCILISVENLSCSTYINLF